MTTPAQVRAAIAAAITTNSAFRGTAYLADQINPPEIQVDYEITYNLVMGNSPKATYPFVFQAFVPRDSERSSQILLDNLRDPNSDTSLSVVLEGDSALAALVDYIDFSHASRIQSVDIAGGQYLMVEFNAEVVF